MNELFPATLCLASVVSKNKDSVHMRVHLRDRVRAFQSMIYVPPLQKRITPDYIPEIYSHPPPKVQMLLL